MSTTYLYPSKSSTIFGSALYRNLNAKALEHCRDFSLNDGGIGKRRKNPLGSSNVNVTMFTTAAAAASASRCASGVGEDASPHLFRSRASLKGHFKFAGKVSNNSTECIESNPRPKKSLWTGGNRNRTHTSEQSIPTLNSQSSHIFTDRFNKNANTTTTTTTLYNKKQFTLPALIDSSLDYARTNLISSDGEDEMIAGASFNLTDNTNSTDYDENSTFKKVSKRRRHQQRRKNSTQQSGISRDLARRAVLNIQLPFSMSTQSEQGENVKLSATTTDNTKDKTKQSMKLVNRNKSSLSSAVVQNDDVQNQTQLPPPPPSDIETTTTTSKPKTKSRMITQVSSSSPLKKRVSFAADVKEQTVHKVLRKKKSSARNLYNKRDSEFVFVESEVLVSIPEFFSNSYDKSGASSSELLNFEDPDCFSFSYGGQKNHRQKQQEKLGKVPDQKGPQGEDDSFNEKDSFVIVCPYSATPGGMIL